MHLYIEHSSIHLDCHTWKKKIFIVQANTQNMHITAVGIFWISFDFKIMFRFDFCSRFMWN